jgi:hypothetical protein
MQSFSFVGIHVLSVGSGVEGGGGGGYRMGLRDCLTPFRYKVCVLHCGRRKTRPG